MRTSADIFSFFRFGAASESKEEKDSASFEIIGKSTYPKMPVTGRYYSDFVKKKTLTSSTHAVSLCHEFIAPEIDTEKKIKKPGKINTYFLKKNRFNSLRSPLEAIASRCIGLLTSVAHTFAIYNDEQQPIGVCSTEIPYFTAAADNPPTEAQLKLPIPPKLAENGFEELEKFDQQITAVESKIILLEKEKEWLQWIENQLSETKASDEDIPKFEIKITNKQSILLTALEKNDFSENYEKLRHNNRIALLEKEKEIIILHEKFNKQFSTKNSTDLLYSYRLRKWLAKMTVAWIINEEGDAHFRNFCIPKKDKIGGGKCTLFDYDMSLLRILIRHKTSRFKLLRAPTKKMFRLSRKDIENFPNLEDSAPPYWLTNQMETSSLSQWSKEFCKKKINQFKKFLNRPENLYPEEKIKLFQELAVDPIYIHYKYTGFLEACLTTLDIYENINLENMPTSDIDAKKKEIKREEENIIKNRSAHIENVIRKTITIPAFQVFFEKFGKKVAETYIRFLTEKNYRFNPKKIWERYEELSLSIKKRKEEKNAIDDDQESIPEEFEEETYAQHSIGHSIETIPIFYLFKIRYKLKMIAENYIPTGITSLLFSPAQLPSAKKIAVFCNEQEEKSDIDFFTDDLTEEELSSKADAELHALYNFITSEFAIIQEKDRQRKHIGTLQTDILPVIKEFDEFMKELDKHNDMICLSPHIP